MYKKLFIISGLVIMMLLTTITVPIVAAPNEIKILGRTHIKAIGSFAICEEDEVLYGHIFIGLIGLKPVFNSNIEYNLDSIRWIVLAGVGIGEDVQVYRYLNCVVVKE